MSSLEYLGLFLKVLSEKKSLGEVLTENPGIKEKLSWTQEEERILNLYQGNIIQNRESSPQPFQMPEGVWHYPTAQEGIKMLVKAVVDHVPNSPSRRGKVQWV